MHHYITQKEITNSTLLSNFTTIMYQLNLSVKSVVVNKKSKMHVKYIVKRRLGLEHKVCAVMAKQEAGILEYHLDVGDGVKMFADIVYKHLNVLVECKIFSPYATRHAVSQATAGANMISQIEQCEYKKIIYLVVKSGKYTLASVRPFVEHTKKYVDGAANIMFRLITVSNDGVLISAEYF